MLQAKRLEEERQESERRAAEAARKREEQRRASDVMRKQRMKEIQAKFAKAGRFGSDAVLLSGVVTVQTSVSNSWKRRFFELKSDALLFYRDSQVGFSSCASDYQDELYRVIALLINMVLNFRNGQHRLIS